jgi:hypothetical protein
MYNIFKHSVLCKDLLFEFIQDAKSKDESDGEYEIGYFRPNQNIEIIKSLGNFFLNKPDSGKILFEEKDSDFSIIISAHDSFVNTPESKVYVGDDNCMIEAYDRKHKKTTYLGIVCHITLELDHPITISTNSSGTDWTGYIGGMIFKDEDIIEDD